MSEDLLFETLEAMVVATAASVRPPERLTVPEAAVKYRFLNNPGSFVGKWTNDKTPYLIEPMECLTDPDLRSVVFAGPAQCGKALALDTPIATPSGWTTMGELKVGDFVFDETGTPTKVVFVTDFMYGHECFSVEFDDGEFIVADADHVWSVSNPAWEKRGPRPERKRSGVDEHRLLTTEDIARYPQSGRSRVCVDVAKPLDLPTKDLPIDPYVFGVWLGDGARHSSRITCGAGDLPALRSEIEARGWKCAVSYNKDRAPDMALVGPDGESLAAKLIRIGLAGFCDKVIPAEYLRASVFQREELLRGLMDTDGWAVKGKRSVNFGTSEESLLRGVEELLSSLGVKFTVRSKRAFYRRGGEKFEGKRAYTVAFTPPESMRVFGFKRKQRAAKIAALTNGAREGQTSRRWIRGVHQVGSVPVRCIQVDSKSHLYLAGRKMVPTHNTELILNLLLYTAICNPMDMMIVQTSQATARDFSTRRVARLFRHSEDVGATILPGASNKNVFDTKFISGMLLTLSWPTINELSGKPIPIVALTDYDRMPEDIDGEGAPFDLARTRTRTFGRNGMTLAESSPGFIVEKPNFVLATPHEAPPTKGILALYNRGDRRRYYWRCVGCETPFMPTFSLLKYPDSADPLESAEAAVLHCPHCGLVYDHDGRDSPSKDEMNCAARWVADGGVWKADGSIGGNFIRSDIASFWFPGVCAHFASWKSLVVTYIQAQREFVRTGSEEAIKTTVNTDQGDVYTPVSMRTDRNPDEIKGRSKETPRGFVPEGVRFLVATIDVQKSRFEIQVHGFGELGEMWIVDRFALKESKRRENETSPYHWINPASYAEDWDLLIEAVIEKTYPLDDDSGRVMPIFQTACDSGGREGVTSQAYDFWRRLREADANHHARFHLVKGASLVSAPRVARSFPDSERKDRRAGARGEVPVLMINPVLIKDQAAAILDRTAPGGARINFPAWLPDSFYSELTVEVRTERGWENAKKQRNESWDLLCYAIACALAGPINLEHIDWASPPRWAEGWDKNSLVKHPNSEPEPETIPKATLASLAAQLL